MPKLTFTIGGIVFNKSAILYYDCPCNNGNQDMGVRITSVTGNVVELPYMLFSEFDREFNG